MRVRRKCYMQGVVFLRHRRWLIRRDIASDHAVAFYNLTHFNFPLPRTLHQFYCIVNSALCHFDSYAATIVPLAKIKIHVMTSIKHTSRSYSRRNRPVTACAECSRRKQRVYHTPITAFCHLSGGVSSQSSMSELQESRSGTQLLLPDFWAVSLDALFIYCGLMTLYRHPPCGF
jgi:hypothetical protein